MKILRRTLVLLAAWAALALVVNGCVCVVHHYDARRPTPVYVAGPPPAVKAETPPPAPSGVHVWVGGHWDWNEVEGEWIWSDGQWQEPPSDESTWEEPSYEENDGDWVYTPGYWNRPGPGPVTDTPMEIMPGSDTPARSRSGHQGEAAGPTEPVEDGASDGGVAQPGHDKIVAPGLVAKPEEPGQDDDPYAEEPDPEEQPGKAVKVVKPGKPDEDDEPEGKAGKPEKAGKAVKPGKPDKDDEPEGKADKPEKAGKPGRPAGLAPAAKGDDAGEGGKKSGAKGGLAAKPRASGSDKPAKECKKSKVCNCDDTCDPAEAKSCPDCKR